VIDGRGVKRVRFGKVVLATVAVTATLLLGVVAPTRADGGEPKAPVSGAVFDATAKSLLASETTAAVSADGEGNVVLYSTAPEGQLAPDAQSFADSHSNVVVEHLDAPLTAYSVNDVVGGSGMLLNHPNNTTGTVYACSVGYGAWSSTGSPVVLTAGHCSNDGVETSASAADPTRDPAGGGTAGGGVSSLGSLGTLAFSQFGGTGNTVASESDPNATDVSVYTVSNPSKTILPRVTDWRTAASKDLAASSFPIRKVGTVQTGSIARSGRTTGYQTGTVASVGGWATVSGRYVYGFGSWVTSDHGDSGGAVFQGDTAVGLVSGGGTSRGRSFMWAADLTTALRVAGSYEVALFIDPPAVSSPANSATVLPGTLITGTGAAGTTLKVYQGSSTTPATVAVNSAGRWSFSAPTTPGSYQYRFVLSKGYDNSAPVTWNIVVSAPSSTPTTAPTPTITPTPTPTPTPSVSPPPVADGLYRLNTPGGQALDVSAGGTTDGTKVQIWSDNGTAAQIWQVTWQGDGTYSVVNPRSGKSLDVNGGRSDNGTQVQIYTGNGTCAQRWSIVANGSGYSLLSACSAKALDVSAGGTANGTKVQIFDRNGTSAQTWFFNRITAPVADGLYRLNTPGGQALDVSAGGTTDGTKVQIWSDNGTAAQIWQVTWQGDGTYSVVNPRSGKSLDVNGGRSDNGTQVQIYTGNGTCAQRWSIVANGSGYSLLSACSAKALDVSAGGTANGTKVQIFDRNGTSAQTWFFNR